MSNPLVSIVTPCYNSERFLTRYLDSVLQQDYPAIEQIIVDDGSTDATNQIVKQYASKFSERNYILCYKYQENKGIGGAINSGLKLISGDLFTWCDSDNYYSPNYVSAKVKKFQESPQFSIIRCDGYIVNENNPSTIIGRMETGRIDRTEQKLFYNAILEKHFHFGCAMLKTADFDRINPQREIFESRAGQNWQLLLPMFYHYRSGYVPKPMFYFVERAGSVSDCMRGEDQTAKLLTLNAHEEILLETINSMKIPEEKDVKELITKKYARKRISIFVSAGDMHKAKLESLKLYGSKKMRILDVVLYYSMKYNVAPRLVVASIRLWNKVFN